MSSAETAMPATTTSDTGEPRPPFPPALMARVGFLLQMVRGGTMGICMSALEPLDLHVKQFGLLSVLDTEGPQSQQALSEWTRHDRTTMVALVDSLEGRGLVRRERNPSDRRAYLVQITPEGRRLLRRAEVVMAEAEDRVLASLSAEEAKLLRALLAKVAVDIGRPPVEVPDPA